MYDAAPSPWLVPFDGSFAIADAPTARDDVPSKKKSKKALAGHVDELAELQRVLYAHNRHSVLLVFQAMDAAGKDSTIRAVMSGVNPAGCQVYSFKQPSTLELDHDFLWRTTSRNPQRGMIGIFNRSYYEEVLVVKVHPEFLEGQRLPHRPEDFFESRYASIRDHELHLARNGTLVLKFFLNVSKDAQKKRFLDRIDDPTKNWKFSKHDLAERQLWPAYQEAYQDALRATSRPWAPWYSIPADDKPSMRASVAQIVVANLRQLDMGYPVLPDEEKAKLAEYRTALTREEA
jgi:PPK2 family polyphosphate:nucleotide phosphotransferase